jgi:hypothetical protein
MKEYITIWTDKGHTRKKLPHSAICDAHWWSPERYDSGKEYMVLIDPVLGSVGDTKQFRSGISISHRSLTHIGGMREKGNGRGWTYVRDRRIGYSVLYSSVNDKFDYSVHMYANRTKQVPPWMLSEAIEIFHSAREEFFRIFRPYEDLDNT